MSKRVKQEEERETRIIELSEDELRRILIYVAKSVQGARDLANVLAVCLMFSTVGKCEEVLRAVNFFFADLSECCVRNHLQINGLVSLAAKAGNSFAQYKFGKLIITSCAWSMQPEYENIHKVDPLLRNWIPDYFYRNTNQDDISQACAFLAELKLKMSENDGRGLSHYRFVRVFLRGSPANNFKHACYCLSCYLVYFGKEYEEFHCLLSEMWKAHVHFKVAFNRTKVPRHVQRGRGPRTSIAKWNAKFEQNRSLAINIFDNAFSFEE